MLAVAAHVLAYGLLLALLWQVVWSFGRIDAAKEERLRAIAKLRGWRLPETIDWESLRVEVDASGVPVTLHVTQYQAKAHARTEATSGEHVVAKRRGAEDGLEAYPGLTRALTGDATFDEACDLFTVDGASPDWLSASLREGLAAVDGPVGLTRKDGAVRVELPRTVRDADLLVRLVDLAAAATDPSASAAVARSLPPGRTPEETHFRWTLLVLPLSMLLATGLTAASETVRDVQSRLICGEGVELSWEDYEGGRGQEFLRGCGDDGESAENLTAWLLAVELFAVPASVLALVASRRRRRPGSAFT